MYLRQAVVWMDRWVGGAATMTGRGWMSAFGGWDTIRWNEMEGVGELLNALWGETGAGWLDGSVCVGVGQACSPDVCPG